MRSLAVLGLAGLAANVQAHPVHDDQHPAALSRRGVDINQFTMPDVSNYTASTDVGSNAAAAAVGKRETYVETATEFLKKELPGAKFRLVDDHFVSASGVAHVNFRQTHNGIDIDNGDFKVNVGSDGKIFSFGNNFFAGKLPQGDPGKKPNHINPVEALKGVAQKLGLPIDAGRATAENKEDNVFVIKSTSGTQSDPEAKLVYFSDGKGGLTLSWRVETDLKDNWLLTYVDAKEPTKVHGVVDYVADAASFQVFPFGAVADPSVGSRVIVKDPWTSASPFGWLSDGTTNYTTTEGNNGHAQNNPTGGDVWVSNYRPKNAERKFEYPYSSSLEPKDYVDFSATQLFYTSNSYHDLLYALGFTEVAGNFQDNNNGKGGRAADGVILNTQDGSGVNNAYFSTPPDGQRGRMLMYVWDRSEPNRDSSLDSGVVIHEYTHGLSNRLTGGPANSGCLSSTEPRGMGEGWSDFFAVALDVKKTQTRAHDNAFGAWIFNNPRGIRTFPYSTSLTTNTHTYAKADGLTSQHAIGNIWATMLYEVLWNLIDKHGNSGAYYPTLNSKGAPQGDGRFLAMKLALDGMALQTCNPNFVQARNAILDADRALTGSANHCEIWKGFAKRGLGQGARYNSSKRTEDFTVPAGICS
ncbi:elastinolytic metalloproteinase Mep [Cordyceps militaris CM01]|uniref:Extracellular metalloproteinase n=1 Tax=Cordyceps militaris (strain CM01) TaxID=983644 RepID=G3J5N8_CORMM|nr:elastinolytic metalloproteinase Mep [Cordyceps militaris CM01]EGX96894.1 elastinolytic metalloproteinase Mep [Cordyceps militaris CM01]